MKSSPVSVVICSHNPRRPYLARVMEALRRQSLPKTQWELIVVDNKSAESIAEWLDLSWHPLARIVREDELGLTPARLRGISESSGDVVVFVDDDNILEDSYLSHVQDIHHEWPNLGAWGAGRILPEYEVNPDQSLTRHTAMLALIDIERDVWTNNLNDEVSLPYGVGLCVRRQVAKVYWEDCNRDSLSRMLDRRGGSLLSGGDTLIAMTAAKVGLGWGMFTRLIVHHLIPSVRVQQKYLLELREKMTASQCIVRFMRTGILTSPMERWSGKLKYGYHFIRLFLSGNTTEWRFYRADIRGYGLAKRIIQSP